MYKNQRHTSPFQKAIQTLDEHVKRGDLRPVRAAKLARRVAKKSGVPVRQITPIKRNWGV